MENTPLPARRPDRGRRNIWLSMRTSRPSAPGITPADGNGGELFARSLFRWRFGWHMLRWVGRRHCPPVIRGGFMKVRLTVPVATRPAPIRAQGAPPRWPAPRQPGPPWPRRRCSGSAARPRGPPSWRSRSPPAAAADRPPRCRPSSRRVRTSRPAPPPAGRGGRPRHHPAARAGARRRTSPRRAPRRRPRARRRRPPGDRRRRRPIGRPRPRPRRGRPRPGPRRR